MRFYFSLFLALGFAAGASAAAVADSVTIPASGGTPAITGYLARPNVLGSFPAVVVLHGCGGYDDLVTAEANELAGLGYVAIAIDTLKPQGITSACGNPAAVGTSAQYAAAALAWLRTQPYVRGNRLGLVGFSMGGIEIMDLIDPFSPVPPPPGLRVAVAYYPACANRSTNVTVPLQILDGDADDWIPYAPCQALAKAASAVGKTILITTYPGATHAFNEPSNHPRHVMGHLFIYDPSATADADAKMQAFLARYLK